MHNRQEPQSKSLVQRMTELVAGLVALAAFAGVVASGWSPPRPAGGESGRVYVGRKR